MARRKKVEEPEIEEQLAEEPIEEPVKKKPKKVLTPAEEEAQWEREAEERRRPWGFRYQVSIAKKEEPNCYVDFYDCDTYKEAEQVCIDKAYCEDRECTVWDYDAPRPDKTVFRCKPPKPEDPVTGEGDMDSADKSAGTSKQRTRSVKRK